MKFLHLSDLHLGVRLYGLSLLEDQEYILNEILKIVDKEKPDGVLIAGDVYDTSVPPLDALHIFEDFLTALAARKVGVFIISGNHDSGVRLSFGASLMDDSGVRICGSYDGKITPITIEDTYGKVDIWLLPFVKASTVRSIFPEVKLDTWTDALRTVVEHMLIDASRRNVLVAHQFVTGSKRSESEEVNVGGADNVDVSVFDPFDYVALGHLHSPQNCSSQRVRYCGTPIKYSFSEARDLKSVTVVELGEKGTLNVRTVELKPLRGMAELMGTYADLTYRRNYEGTSYCDDYLHITLTDEEDVPDAMAKLRLIYKNLLRLDYDNKRTQNTEDLISAEKVISTSPVDLFKEFYKNQNGQPMSEEQVKYVISVVEQLKEAKK